MRHLLTLALLICLPSLAPAGEPPKLRIDRLERLADHLDTLGPDDGFHMGQYSSCAAGKATLIAEFADAGLWYRHEVIHYRDLENSVAIAAFFGLSSDQTNRLFGTRYYGDPSLTNPRLIAAEIRAVCRGSRALTAFNDLVRERRARS